MENFKVNLASASKIQLDLLLEIAAWQSVIINHLAKEAAKTNNSTFDQEAQKFEEMKAHVKNTLFDQVFVNSGPDLGDDLLNNG